MTRKSISKISWEKKGSSKISIVHIVTYNETLEPNSMSLMHSMHNILSKIDNFNNYLILEFEKKKLNWSQSGRHILVWYFPIFWTQALNWTAFGRLQLMDISQNYCPNIIIFAYTFGIFGSHNTQTCKNTLKFRIEDTLIWMKFYTYHHQQKTKCNFFHINSHERYVCEFLRVKFKPNIFGYPFEIRASRVE